MHFIFINDIIWLFHGLGEGATYSFEFRKAWQRLGWDAVGNFGLYSWLFPDVVRIMPAS